MAIQSMAVAALALASAATFAQANPAPPSTTASPDVYKVLAENARFRIVQVTWAPGQKDLPHSHPESGAYFLDSCQLRFFNADGSTNDTRPLAGHSVVQGAIASHAVQNIGTAPCRIVMFEAK